MQVNRRQFLKAAPLAPAVAVTQQNPEPLMDRGFARVTRAADGVIRRHCCSRRPAVHFQRGGNCRPRRHAHRGRTFTTAGFDSQLPQFEITTVWDCG
jgi:hypothetical protein